MAKPSSCDVFLAIRVYYGKLGCMLKPIVPKFRPDLSAHLKEIAEKQVPREAEAVSSYFIVTCQISARSMQPFPRNGKGVSALSRSG